MLLKSSIALVAAVLFFTFYQYQSHTNASLVEVDNELYRQTIIFKTNPGEDWRANRTRKGIPSQSADLFSESWIDFDAGRIERATIFLKNLSENSQGEVREQALLNLAYIQYQTKNYVAAEQNIMPLRQSSTVEIRQNAQWLLVNTYLQNNQMKALQAFLPKIIDDPNHAFRNAAVGLANDLNSFWRFGN